MKQLLFSACIKSNKNRLFFQYTLSYLDGVGKIRLRIKKFIRRFCDCLTQWCLSMR